MIFERFCGLKIIIVISKDLVGYITRDLKICIFIAYLYR